MSPGPRTTSGTLIHELVRQGIGVSVMIKDDVDRLPELERIVPELPPIPVPVWLVTHRELHTSRRIRLVFDMIAEAFAEGRQTEWPPDRLSAVQAGVELETDFL